MATWWPWQHRNKRIAHRVTEISALIYYRCKRNSEEIVRTALNSPKAFNLNLLFTQRELKLWVTRDKGVIIPVILWSVVGVYFQRRLENTFDNVKVINILELLFYRSYRRGKNVADLDKICTFNRTKVYEICGAKNIWT